jgi:hypothetical protein
MNGIAPGATAGAGAAATPTAAFGTTGATGAVAATGATAGAEDEDERSGRNAASVSPGAGANPARIGPPSPEESSPSLSESITATATPPFTSTRKLKARPDTDIRSNQANRPSGRPSPEVGAREVA